MPSAKGSFVDFLAIVLGAFGVAVFVFGLAAAVQHEPLDLTFLLPFETFLGAGWKWLVGGTGAASLVTWLFGGRVSLREYLGWTLSISASLIASVFVVIALSTPKPEHLVNSPCASPALVNALKASPRDLEYKGHPEHGVEELNGTTIHVNGLYPNSTSPMEPNACALLISPTEGVCFQTVCERSGDSWTPVKLTYKRPDEPGTMVPRDHALVFMAKGQHVAVVIDGTYDSQGTLLANGGGGTSCRIHVGAADLRAAVDTAPARPSGSR